MKGRLTVVSIALDNSITLREYIENVVQSFGLHHGINRHGQVVCGHYDDSVDTTASYPHYKDLPERDKLVAIKQQWQ